VADLLESIAAEIEARQAKLKPIVAEYERLQAAAAALGPQHPPQPGAARKFQIGSANVASKRSRE
jgi:hypothetical protein